MPSWSPLKNLCRIYNIYSKLVSKLKTEHQMQSRDTEAEVKCPFDVVAEVRMSQYLTSLICKIDK